MVNNSTLKIEQHETPIEKLGRTQVILKCMQFLPAALVSPTVLLLNDINII
jgi:hypothetical protein